MSWNQSDYDRMACAISYITSHVNEQPNLEDIAAHVNLSPYHFQRLFSRWAGVTPKRFLQVLTLEHAKRLLNEPKPLLEVSDSVGLSSGSRLYDHFVQLEAVTPGEYKLEGKGVTIDYAVHDTPFGKAFIAITQRGICAFTFLDNEIIDKHLNGLARKWPQAVLLENDQSTGSMVQAMFGEAMFGEAILSKDKPSKNSPHKPITAEYPLSLYIRGTNFQISVWKALLQIPPAKVASYAQIAKAIGRPRAARAVGLAAGANPVAFLIPCHRVIQQSGKLGGYHWGEARKHAIHAWEAARYG